MRTSVRSGRAKRLESGTFRIPHATAGSRRLERGDMVLFDLSGVVGGYLSDITRMTTFGDATV